MSKTQYLFILASLWCVTSYAQNLTGKWKLDANIQNLGNMQILIDFTQTSDTSFYASSRPGALKDIIGGVKYAIAKSNIAYKNGSIVHIYRGIIKGDSLGGAFTTPMMNLHFSAQLKDGKMEGTLSGKNKQRYKFTAKPYKNEFINYDYKALVEDIKTTFQDNIYDPEILKIREYTDFFARLNQLAPKIHDDLEMFMDFSFLKEKLKMSHIALLKYNPWDSYDEKDTLKSISLVSHKMIDDKTGYIKFKGFRLRDTSIVRGFLKTIIAKEIPNLIFDLRGCSGGDYSSMYLAQYLIKKPRETGFFIGNKYYQKHRNLPDENTVSNLPNYNGKSVREFLKTIRENGLLKGEISPNKDLHYKGKAYVLTSNNTASASEPIAYLLKQHNLATLVGETTAGEMLSSTTITVRDFWSLTLPIADYYTSDRFRIEQKGVSPNITVKSEEALNYLLKSIE